jgi:hypothetical protein
MRVEDSACEAVRRREQGGGGEYLYFPAFFVQ